MASPFERACAASALVGYHRRMRLALWLGAPWHIGPLPEPRVLASKLDVDAVVVDADALEQRLGRPVPTVPLEQPPANALELGLLELEEDVLRDAYTLASATFATTLRRWRRSLSTEAIETLSADWQAADIPIASVSWAGAGGWSAEDLSDRCRVCVALSASLVVPPTAALAASRLA
jgi:hypothetical protein